MSAALNATGRPVLYSICNWGRHDPWLWAPEIANMWRTTMDVWPQWHRVASILDSMAGLSAYGGRGGFNDADMIEVGVDSRIFNWAGMPETNLTEREAAAHFTMWAIMGAPLVLGLDLEAAERWALDVVSHAGVLAVNQDPLAYPGRRVTSDSDAVLGVGPASPSGGRTPAVDASLSFRFLRRLEPFRSFFDGRALRGFSSICFAPMRPSSSCVQS